MNDFDHRSFYRCSEKGLNGGSNPDLCDAGAVLYQLSYQAKWEQVVMWVDYKPVDVEMDDYNTGIFHVFELQIEISSSISTSTGL